MVLLKSEKDLLLQPLKEKLQQSNHNHLKVEII